MVTPVHVWLCNNGHTFPFGDEEWHFEVTQGPLEDGAPIPMYCTQDHEETDESMGRYEGDPCLDSTSLIDMGVVR